MHVTTRVTAARLPVPLGERGRSQGVRAHPWGGGGLSRCGSVGGRETRRTQLGHPWARLTHSLTREGSLQLSP